MRNAFLLIYSHLELPVGLKTKWYVGHKLGLNSECHSTLLEVRGQKPYH